MTEEVFAVVETLGVLVEAVVVVDDRNAALVDTGLLDSVRVVVVLIVVPLVTVVLEPTNEGDMDIAEVATE